MKIQDIGFFFVFGILLALRRPRWLVIAGLACWALAVPLFASWVFFSAQRLMWYGAAFMMSFLVISLVRPHAVE